MHEAYNSSSNTVFVFSSADLQLLTFDSSSCHHAPFPNPDTLKELTFEHLNIEAYV